MKKCQSKFQIAFIGLNLISNSVYWTQSIQKLLEEGVDTFIEFGSGKVLTGLNRKICPVDVKTYNVGDMDSLNATKDALDLVNI